MTNAKFTFSVIIISALIMLAALLVWLSNPWIDLMVGGAFYHPNVGFILNNYIVIETIRSFVIYGYGTWYVTIVVAVIFTYMNKDWWLSKLLGFGLGEWLYLAITSLVGPLLITNVILKNNWGRARPRQLEEFGGSQEFTPPWIFSDQCETNCSFISGEPSSMFMVFFSLAFILPEKRRLTVALAIALGSLSGLMRMGQGGHFLSDVVFAGAIMAATAAMLYWLMFLSKWAK